MVNRRHLLLAATASAAPLRNAHGGPDEISQGKWQGYPASKTAWDNKPYRVGNYSQLASVRTTRPIAAASPARPLVEAAAVNPARQLPPALTQRLAAYLARHPVTGLLVLQGNQVLFEGYGYDRTPEMAFHGWSMSKSVLALLVGIAVQNGLIASVNDTAATYLPELAGTLHGETRLKDLLQMSTGAAVLHKTTSEGGDLGLIYGQHLLNSGSDTFALVQQWNRRGEPAGTRFNYNELAPITLTHVLRRKTGMALADYAALKLWQPLGAQAPASWMVDSKGAELGCVGFSARLRDWGRLGLLLADDGHHGGVQVVPTPWLLAQTTVAATDTHLQPRVATSHSGYGYLTWVEAYRQRRVFSLRGHHSQYLIVAPALRLVLVHTAVEENRDNLAVDLYAIYTALMNELEKRPVPPAAA